MIIYASFEDFLYILAGIAWLAFSIYNANRKKKAAQSKKEQAKKETSTSFLDSLIDELGGANNTPDKDPYEPVYEPYSYEEDHILVKNETINEPTPDVSDLDKEPFSYDDYYEESNYSEISDVIEKDKSIKNYGKTNSITKKSTFKKSRKVNLKKAVIYSEILNKRYF